MDKSSLLGYISVSCINNLQNSVILRNLALYILGNLRSNKIESYDDFSFLNMGKSIITSLTEQTAYFFNHTVRMSTYWYCVYTLMLNVQVTFVIFLIDHQPNLSSFDARLTKLHEKINIGEIIPQRGTQVDCI